MTVYPSWYAAYTKAVREGMETDDAVRFADNTISMSQPTSRPIDLSYFQGSHKGIHRIFTMFSTFTMKYANRKRFFYNKWRAGQMSTGNFIWYNMLESVVAPMLMTIMMSVLRDRELPDKDKLLNDLISYQFIGYPYASDAASIVINQATGSGYRKNLGDSPVFTGSKLLVKATGKALKLSIDDPQSQRDFIWSMAHIVSYQTGVPVSKVLERMAKGMQDMEYGDGTPINLLLPSYKK